VFEMPHNVVGVDLDGVIADIVSQLVRFSRIEYGIHLLPSQLRSERIEICTPINGEQLTKLFQEPGFFRSMRAIPRAKQSLSALREHGYSIHVITDRFWYPDIHDDTRKWLADRSINVESLVFARKTDKQHVARELGVQWFIEDQISNANLLSEVCQVLLIDRPYNQGMTPEGVARVKGIDEAVESIVESILRQRQGGSTRTLQPVAE